MPRRATYASVAAALGEAESTLQYYAKKGCPVLSGSTAQVQAWIDAWRVNNPQIGTGNGGSGSSEVSDQAAKLQLAKASAELHERRLKTQLLDLKYQQRRGLLVELETVEAEFAALGETVKRQLLALPKQIAAELEGLPAREIEALLKTEILRRLRSLQSRRGTD